MTPREDILDRIVAYTRANGKMPEAIGVPIELWQSAREEFKDKFDAWPVAAEIACRNFLVAGVPVYPVEGQPE